DAGDVVLDLDAVANDVGLAVDLFDPGLLGLGLVAAAPPALDAGAAPGAVVIEDRPAEQVVAEQLAEEFGLVGGHPGKDLLLPPARYQVVEAGLEVAEVNAAGHPRGVEVIDDLG